jgi:hypothetical protein
MPGEMGFAQTILPKLHRIVPPPQNQQLRIRRVNQHISELLEKRLGRLHARLRLGLENEHEAQVFGQGINYFHFENLRASHFLIGACLKLSGLYWRGRRNAAKIVVVHNDLTSVQVPDTFDGSTILQLSDLHVDLSQGAMKQLTVLLRDISEPSSSLDLRLAGAGASRVWPSVETRA